MKYGEGDKEGRIRWLGQCVGRKIVFVVEIIFLFKHLISFFKG